MKAQPCNEVRAAKPFLIWGQAVGPPHCLEDEPSLTEPVSLCVSAHSDNLSLTEPTPLRIFAHHNDPSLMEPVPHVSLLTRMS